MTVFGANAAANTQRPDIVLYINGIALGVLELKELEREAEALLAANG